VEKIEQYWLIGFGFDNHPSDLTPYKLLKHHIDVGDFLGVRGELFYSDTWELTLFASEFFL
jgi:lysyl-tRNA synthetase class II